MGMDSELVKFYKFLSERGIIEYLSRGDAEAEYAVKLYNKSKVTESCSNCKFDTECRHKPMMSEGQAKCKFYIKN